MGTRRLGEAITDTGQVAICDIRALEQAVTKPHEAEFNSDILEETRVAGMSVTTFSYGGRSVDIAFSESGFGDGAFHVYPLEAAGKLVGAEVEFLPVNYTTG